MDNIPITKFKATCLAVVEEVQRTGKPVRITRAGKPVAELVPASAERSWLGTMVGTIEFLDDVIAPVTDPSDWDAERE